jgi:hypothetical protein
MTPDPIGNPLMELGEMVPRTIDGSDFCVGLTNDVLFVQVGTAYGTVTNVTATQIEVIVPAAPDGAGPVEIYVNSGPYQCGPILGDYQ